MGLGSVWLFLAAKTREIPAAGGFRRAEPSRACNRSGCDFRDSGAFSASFVPSMASPKNILAGCGAWSQSESLMRNHSSIFCNPRGEKVGEIEPRRHSSEGRSGSSSALRRASNRDRIDRTRERSVRCVENRPERARRPRARQSPRHNLRAPLLKNTARHRVGATFASPPPGPPLTSPSPRSSSPCAGFL